MTILPNSLIAQTIHIPSNLTFSVKDQYNPSSARTVTLYAAYYRIGCAANGDATASGATSELTAAELLNALTQRMNAGIATNVWSWGWTTTGRVKLTYSGTGTGEISAWDSGEVIKNLLGFTGLTGSISSGQSATATYQPTHCVFLVGRDLVAPYEHQRQNVAAVQTRGGRVVAAFGGKRPLVVAFDSSLHPTTAAYQSSLALWSTPVEPDRDPVTVSDAAGVTAPWSMLDFMGASWGHALGMLSGTFQDEVAGTATKYDLLYLLPDAKEANSLIDRSYIGQQMIKGLRFSVKEKGKAL